MTQPTPTPQELEFGQYSSAPHTPILQEEERRAEQRRTPQNRRVILKHTELYNAGYVSLLGVFGSDNTIAESARVSYDKGTIKVSDDKRLLRYLIKHNHTSPLEQAEVRFQIKIPEFVFRQFVRHRTWNLNVVSARYSEIEYSFYVPELKHIQKQATTNNQGRGEAIDPETQEEIQDLIAKQNEDCYLIYQELLGLGVARELARTVINSNVFVKLVCKCDLHNFFHFLKLRLDSHAQLEIQMLAQVMYDQIKEYFPLCCEAFEDYTNQTVTFSKQEMELLQKLLQGVGNERIHFLSGQMTQREVGDFISLLRK